jgi:adenylate cyclase
MLSRLLRPSAFKVALLVGLGFGVLHSMNPESWAVAHYLNLLELKGVDWKFAMRGPLPLSHRVALAEVDERAVAEHGLWPWDRSLLARSIDRLFDAGARVVALDMVIADPDRNSSYRTMAELQRTMGKPDPSLPGQVESVLARAPASLRPELTKVMGAALQEHAQLAENAGALSRALAKPPDAVLAETVARHAADLVLGGVGHTVDDHGKFAPETLAAWQQEIRSTLVPTASKLTFQAGNPVWRPYPPQAWKVAGYDTVEVWLPEIAGPDRFFGFFSVSPDFEGTIRHYLPVRSYHGGFFPSLAMAAVARASHAAVVPVGDSQGYLEEVGTYVDSPGIHRGEAVVVAPVDTLGGRMLINYVGPNVAWRSAGDRDAAGQPVCSGATCDRVSLADVLAGTFDPALVKDKIVFLSVTALGTFDQRVTPFDSYGPGVYVHMNVAESFLSQRFIDNSAYLKTFEVLFLLGLAVLFGVLLPRIGLAGQLATLPLGLSGTLAANIYAFNHGVQLATVTPLLEIVTLVFGVVFFQYFSTDKEKRQVRQAFQYYLTESVMTEMLADPSKLKLGGVKKELTVMFSDIRGFTTLSEMLEASEVAKTLNEYLTPMTNLVFQTGGTLDKYMGDAIMAFWGAPLDQKDHALKACQTACAMIERLDVMRAEWKAKGRPDIDIGIGLNSGNIHVGNMGSDIRFDYTVIGDDVNLASRLEGTNKSYGTRVILGENTYRMVAGEVVGRELGGVVVKGKKKPVTIFELRRMGAPNPDEARAISAFERGLAAYRRRAWDEAELCFGEVLTLWPHDGPSEKYLDDVAEKRAHAPDAGWDGVYVMKTK